MVGLKRLNMNKMLPVRVSDVVCCPHFFFKTGSVNPRTIKDGDEMWGLGAMAISLPNGNPTPYI